jgi:hypothetical protein
MIILLIENLGNPRWEYEGQLQVLQPWRKKIIAIIAIKR